MELSAAADSAVALKKIDNASSTAPKSFAQWQFACALVKSLYLQGALNTCTERANELLKITKLHLVHETFLNFYAALSHETLAEKLGDHHNEYHANLDAAEHHLSAALNRVSPAVHEKAQVPTHQRDSGYEALKRDITCQQRSSSESSQPSTEIPSTRDSKSSQTTVTNAAQEVMEDIGARGRYNRILLSLRPELEAHVNFIKTMRQDATELISRSTSRAGEVKELQETMAKMAVKQHVIDGRKRNWKRARFSLSNQVEVPSELSRAVSQNSADRQALHGTMEIKRNVEKQASPEDTGAREEIQQQ